MTVGDLSKAYIHFPTSERARGDDGAHTQFVDLSTSLPDLDKILPNNPGYAEHILLAVTNKVKLPKFLVINPLDSGVMQLCTLSISSNQPQPGSLGFDLELVERAHVKCNDGVWILPGAKIEKGCTVGEGSIVAGQVRGGAVLGRNCIVGKHSSINGGRFGDSVVIGERVLSGPNTYIQSNVLISDGTSLAGKVEIMARSIVGPECTLENISIGELVLLGGHCDTEGFPTIQSNKLIPPGSLISMTSSDILVIEPR